LYLHPQTRHLDLARASWLPPQVASFLTTTRSHVGQGYVPSQPRPLTWQKKKIHKPSHEVNVQLSNANFAYIRGDMAQAINDFREVIRLDPRIASAWKSLATCYTEQGEVELAREMRFCGLHVEGDADEWKEMAFEFR
jgi:general transcription factor 3C polypeptide 3 (transcription factor C subunit 4)